MANKASVEDTGSSPEVSTGTNDENPQQGSGMRAPSPANEACTALQVAEANNSKPRQAGRSSTTKTPPNKKDYRKLFVGGLPADITDEEFTEYFSQFGELLDCVVMFDRETQRSRGFGFVTYKNAEVANRLLAMGHEDDIGGESGANTEPQVGRLVMRGKTCEVKAAQPKESARGANRRSQSAGLAHIRRSSDKAQVSSNRAVGNSHLRHPHHTGSSFEGGSIYMGNQPYYPMLAPEYYPATYFPHVYGAGGYGAASAYAPVVPTSSAQVDSRVHANFKPPVATHVDPASLTYPEGHDYYSPYPYAYVSPSYHQQVAMHTAVPSAAATLHTGQAVPASSSSPSAMHPSAPGIRSKEETV